MYIGSEQRRIFERDGLLYLGRLLDDAALSTLLASVERLQEREARKGLPEGYFDRERLWERDDGMREICLESSLPAVAASLLAVERVNLLYDQVFIKTPGSDIRTTWHNDLPNWPFRGTQLVSLWLALDTIDAENGALEFVRGSHRWERWYPPFNADVDGRFTGLHETATDDQFDQDPPDIESAREAYDIVCDPMEPGEGVAFHALTVHGAQGNCRPDRQRRGYSVRYGGPDVRYYAGSVVNVGITNPSLTSGDRLRGPQYPEIKPLEDRDETQRRR